LAQIVVDDFAYLFTEVALRRLRTPLGVKLAALIQPKVKLVKEMADQLVPLCTPGAVEVDPSGLKWMKNPDLKIPLQAAVRHAVEMLSQKVSASVLSGVASVDSVHSPSSEDLAVWGSVPSLEQLGITAAEVDAFLRQVSEQHGVKLGDLAQPMRLTVTGRLVSAGLFELISLLPWDVVEARLRKVEQL
jgi:glutamyl/glutaminyl-tRNA synthetase